MNAIKELKNKGFAEQDAVERAIVAHWEDWHLADTNVIQAEKAAEEYAALKARAENAEASLKQEVQNVFDLEMKLDSKKNDYEELNVLYEKLEIENNAMYAALLEASELGNLANKRCKVELQRIARNDAMKAGAK